MIFISSTWYPWMILAIYETTGEGVSRYTDRKSKTHQKNLDRWCCAALDAALCRSLTARVQTTVAYFIKQIRKVLRSLSLSTVRMIHIFLFFTYLGVSSTYPQARMQSRNTRLTFTYFSPILWQWRKGIRRNPVNSALRKLCDPCAYNNVISQTR